jgi:2-polyprenyl-3-methyl-5-hydroxy-6-metoxy-1,4-benzoquinol methylase
MMEPYTNDFYSKYRGDVRSSAQEIVPYLIDLILPKSVIDVGCGVGTWLSVFNAHGIKDILGIDGEYVDAQMLEIPGEAFMPTDIKKPIRLERRYDLVISLEVAEHLPIESAIVYVESLTNLGPVILFSAAIPFQGGANHINEQWPEYWAEHFKGKGFTVVDCIRRRFWRNQNVKWWYAQNTLLFVEDNFLKASPNLKQEREITFRSQLSIVHPQRYIQAIERSRLYFESYDATDTSK